MEVALIPRFLQSQILFSLTSKFDRSLKEEIWLCHKYMDLSMEDILKMTTSDRKTYITMHNRLSEKEKDRLEKFSKRK